MSKILDKAIDRIKTLPTNRQDQIGEMLIDVVDQDQADAHLSPEQQGEVRRRMSEPKPIVATEDQLEAFFRKFVM